VSDDVGTRSAGRAAPELHGRETGLVAWLPLFDRVEGVPSSLEEQPQAHSQDSKNAPAHQQIRHR
jgi:hypothetical protein